MGRAVDEGMTAGGEGDGEGVTARVGLAEGVDVARTATGGPEDDVVCDVGACEQAVRTAATTTATIPTLILPHRAGGKMSDTRFMPDSGN
jgi:hypothetical protein